jgi:hypothetical protein
MMPVNTSVAASATGRGAALVWCTSILPFRSAIRLRSDRSAAHNGTAMVMAARAASKNVKSRRRMNRSSVSSIMNARPDRRNELLTERSISSATRQTGASATLCITSDMPDTKSSKTELVFPFLPTVWESHVDRSNLEP